MNEKRIEQASNVIVEKNVPSNLGMRFSLQGRLRDRPRPFYQTLKLSPSRLYWIALTAMFLLLFGTTVYAVSPTIRQLLRMDSALNQVEMSGLGQSLHLSQTVEDVTVSLEWTYADENRIAVVYTIHSLDGKQYDLRQITLTDKDGTNFNLITGMVTTIGAAEFSEVTSLLNTGGYVLSFDASPVSGMPATLDLHLNMVLETVAEKEIVGSIAFDFTTPFHYGIVVEPSQTVTAVGKHLTLEKIVITPSDMTAIICFDKPEDGYSDWLPISSIQVESEETSAYARVGSQSSQDEKGCTHNRYFPPLYNQPGSWTLTVTELVGFKIKDSLVDPESAEAPEQLRVKGPWVFEFEMP